MTKVIPVKYDPATVKHTPFRPDDKIDGTAINIGKDTNNLLRLDPDNGLVVTLTAPPDVQVQYVSSVSGDDKNPGTHDAPLKTISRAIARLPDATSGTILLKAGETFSPEDGKDLSDMTVSGIMLRAIDVGNRSVTFSPYDDPVWDQINSIGGGRNPIFYGGVKQPRVVFNFRVPSDSKTSTTVSGIVINGTGSVTFNQLDLVMVSNGTNNGILGYSAFDSGNGLYQFNGCTVRPTTVPMFGGHGLSSAALLFTQVEFDTNGGKAIATPNGLRLQASFSDSFGTPSDLPNVGNGKLRVSNFNSTVNTTDSYPGIVILSPQARTYQGLSTTNNIVQA